MFKKLVCIEPVNLVPAAFEKLKELAEEVVQFDTIPETDEEKIARVGDADGVLISWTSTMGRAVIEAAPNLKYVGMCCSLYSEESANVDIKAARERGIVVKGVKDYGDQGVAEYVTFELINYLHGFTGKSWIEKQKELTGMKIGMIGLGATGSIIAHRLIPFGTDMYYYSRTRKPEEEDLGIKYLPLDELLETVDVACMCLNKNVILIGDEQLEKFGNHKILFNTSIGPGHDPDAVIRWLDRGDNVFFGDNEGGVGSEALLNHPKTTCRYKACGSTYESTFRLSDKVINNIKDFFEGR